MSASPDTATGGPWLKIVAKYRHETGKAMAIWTGEMKGIDEAWFWIPHTGIRRPNPGPRTQDEIFEVLETWVIEHRLQGCELDEDQSLEDLQSEQGSFFSEEDPPCI